MPIYTKSELETIYRNAKYRAERAGMTYYGRFVGVTSDARGFGAIVAFEYETFRSFYVYNKISGRIEYVGPAPKPKQRGFGPQASTRKQG